MTALIRGIGIDLTRVSRIEGVLERRGARFLAKAYHPLEIAQAEALPHARRLEYLAGRWAAKEALHKALGGARRLRFPDVSVVRGARGEPQLALHGAARSAVAALGVGAAHVSLAHDGDLAVAHVVLEAAPPAPHRTTARDTEFSPK